VQGKQQKSGKNLALGGQPCIVAATARSVWRVDIYAKVKYSKPWELAPVINQAFSTNSEKESA
jgi:hypothetical protein